MQHTHVTLQHYVSVCTSTYVSEGVAGLATGFSGALSERLTYICVMWAHASAGKLVRFRDIKSTDFAYRQHVFLVVEHRPTSSWMVLVDGPH